MVDNTPGVLTNATADIVLFIILGTARRVVEANHLRRSGNFKGCEPELLLGRDASRSVLALAGFGLIARAMARRALSSQYKRNFRAQTVSHRGVSVEELGEFAGKIQQVQCRELAERSDLLSVHVPLPDQTPHLVDL